MVNDYWDPDIKSVSELLLGSAGYVYLGNKLFDGSQTPLLECLKGLKQDISYFVDIYKSLAYFINDISELEEVLGDKSSEIIFIFRKED